MHPLLALDAALVFALSVPVVMGYRILPVEGTPYWLFGILFFILVTNVVISVYPQLVKRWIDNVMNLKRVLLAATITIVVIGVSWTAIVDRARVAPEYKVHDIILQQEAAMRYLITGKNPYKETYHGTFMEKFHYTEDGHDAENPALYHFVMPPWYLLFPFVFYYTTPRLLGFFDGRMALLFAMVGMLGVLALWFEDRILGNIAIILSSLSPAVIDYFIEGRSDVFALFWFVASLYLLEKRKLMASAVIFALAMLSKQTIWFAAPFYLVYLFLVAKKNKNIIGRAIGVMVIVAVLVVGPFLLWDPAAYIDSTIRFLAGTTEHAYPISGYGFGMMLHSWGIIQNIRDYYPFMFWQILFAVPTLLVSLWMLYKKPTMSRLLMGYGVSLFMVWYFSRYFNNSHVGYLSSIFVLGVLKDLDEKETFKKQRS